MALTMCSHGATVTPWLKFAKPSYSLSGSTTCATSRRDLIILLAGGDKTIQAKDIKTALHLARNLSE